MFFLFLTKILEVIIYIHSQLIRTTISVRSKTNDQIWVCQSRTPSIGEDPSTKRWRTQRLLGLLRPGHNLLIRNKADRKTAYAASPMLCGAVGPDAPAHV